jgi:ribosome maturation factor RimP
VALPIDEMAEAKIVLSDAIISESLRRGKQAERAGRQDDTKGNGEFRRSREFKRAPADRRRAAQHEGE